MEGAPTVGRALVIAAVVFLVVAIGYRAAHAVLSRGAAARLAAARGTASDAVRRRALALAAGATAHNRQHLVVVVAHQALLDQLRVGSGRPDARGEPGEQLR